MARPIALPKSTALALALLPAAASGAQLNYQLGLSALHSDNIGLGGDGNGNTVGDTVISPQLRFDLTQAGSVFSVTASGSAQYLHYVDNTFGDGFRGAFVGQGLWTLLPERLEWSFEDYLSRQPVDTFLAFSPGNEQQANLFVTGPTLYLRLGQTTRGQFDLRYSNSYAADDNSFNSDRYNLAARVIKDMSPTRTLSFNAEATRVEFDLRQARADYDRYQGYLSYSSQFRALDFNLDLGYSRLEFRDRPQRSSQPLLRGDLGWRISPRSTLNLRASHEISDAADNLIVNDSLIGNPVLDDPGNPGVAVTPDVFKQRRLELGYQFVGERLNVQLLPYYQRIGYVGATVAQSDEKDYGGYGAIGYRLRPRTTLSLLAARQVRDFADLDRKDRDTSFGAALENEFTRHWVGRLELQHRRRDSTETGQDYKENVAIISFTYRR